MSVTFSRGFDGVSSQTRRVRGVRTPRQGPLRVRGQVRVAGVHAAEPRDLFEEAERAAVDVVADHDLLARATSSASVAVAADPEANAIPKAPPSSSATARSRRSRVGFCVRAYS